MRKFLKTIEQEMLKSVEDSIRSDLHFACYNYECESGCIEVYYDNRDDYEVIVDHNNGTIRKHPNIEQAIADILPDWYEMEKDIRSEECGEWPMHGFRDAQDFYNYKFGGRL